MPSEETISDCRQTLLAQQQRISVLEAHNTRMAETLNEHTTAINRITLHDSNPRNLTPRHLPPGITNNAIFGSVQAYHMLESFMQSKKIVRDEGTRFMKWSTKRRRAFILEFLSFTWSEGDIYLSGVLLWVDRYLPWALKIREGEEDDDSMNDEEPHVQIHEDSFSVACKKFIKWLHKTIPKIARKNPDAVMAQSLERVDFSTEDLQSIESSDVIHGKRIFLDYHSFFQNEGQNRLSDSDWLKDALQQFETNTAPSNNWMKELYEMLSESSRLQGGGIIESGTVRDTVQDASGEACRALCRRLIIATPWTP